MLVIRTSAAAPPPRPRYGRPLPLPKLLLILLSHTQSRPRSSSSSLPPLTHCFSSIATVPAFSSDESKTTHFHFCFRRQQEGDNEEPLLAYGWNVRLRELVKSGRLQDARHMFDIMSPKDAASWTILLSGYVATSRASEALALFSRMWVSSRPPIRPDPFLLSVTLKACGLTHPVHVRSRLGRPLHAYAVKCGLDFSVFVGSALLDMYAKGGILDSAIQMFDEMPDRNVVTWTAAITALARAGRAREAIACFADMWASRVTCDSHTFAIVLKACADLGQLGCGREIHTQAVRFGFDKVPFVANTLSALYSKCGKIDSGIMLFERMTAPDVVSWTTAISSLSQMGREDQAVQAFVRMLRQGEASARPNEYTFAAVISACAGLAQVTWGEQMHAMAIRIGVALSLSTSNATITMYSRSGRLKAADTLFLEMMIRDVVSWSAIISGHAQEGNVEDAFRLLSEMLDSGIEANEYVLASLLSVCAQMTMLEQGQQIHANVITTGLDVDSMVSSTLVNMYSKCGCVEEAQHIFNGQSYENVVSWTSMINGYAEHGHSKKAVGLFESMQLSGMKPDSITFIGVLSACSHAGLLELGFKYFNLMQTTYQINPEKEHFGCMVDLLCRAGRLNNAEQMIERMPFKPDDVVWSTVLQASKIHGNAECGRRATERILELHSDCAGSLITLSNLYAAKGRWNDVANVRLLMRSKGVRKEPGSSWIVVKERMAVFVSGDLKHPRTDEIYNMLYLLSPKAKTAGSFPESAISQIDKTEDQFTACEYQSGLYAGS